MVLVTAVATAVLCVPVGAGSGAAAQAPAAFVRVNQAGYPAGQAKRAYLLAGAADPGAAFRIVDASGRVVLSGRAGPSLGSWSASFPDVYPIDFSRLRMPGTYRIVVAGVPGLSPPFRIGSGAGLARGPIRNSLAFYQDERDGPDFIRTPLRTAPGHLNDGDAMTYLTPHVDGDGNFAGDLRPLGVRIDAAGGWWDAGDYLKFVETTSYTDAVLLSAVRDFPHAMARPRARAQLPGGSGVRRALAAADVGRPHTHALLPGRDRRGQRPDARRPRHLAAPAGRRHVRRHEQRRRYIRHRPVFRAGPPGAPVSPNLAGRDAAAFGLCFQVYRHTTRASPPAACAPASTSSPWRTRRPAGCSR